MTVFKLSENQKKLIERLGVFHEKNGMQPAASRVLALLLVSDRTELTFDEIREALNISKSATSGAINLLITINQIEYITKPGDRKRYFRNKIFSWKEHLRANFESVTAISSLMKEVLAQRPKETQNFNEAIEEIIDFLTFFQ